MDKKHGKYYAVIMSDGKIMGIPAEIIADNYAKYYEKRGESYKENFDAMMHWFDTDDFEFEDWAKNNMDWSEVKEHAEWIGGQQKEADYDNDWMNERVIYVHSLSGFQSKGE